MLRSLRSRAPTGVAEALALERTSRSIARLAALVRGGLSLEQAWGYLAESGDAGFEDRASRAERLANVALEIARTAGAPVAEALDRLAELFLAQARTHRALDAALAGPKATAKLVAALPLLGFALGAALGLDPLAAIFGTPIGGLGALLGVTLMIAAWRWSSSIVARASRGYPEAGVELELIAIALRGGGGVPAALELVATATDGLQLRSNDAAVRERTLELTVRAGVPAIALLAAEASLARSTEQAATEARAARAAVQLVLPLGCCVLPAFALLGVLPLVIAMVRQVAGPLAG